MAPSCPLGSGVWHDARIRTHVAFLRAINVGGRNLVSMSDLRDLFESAGHTEVTTYVQSGNVVFAAGSDEPDAAAIERHIEDRFGVQAGVVVVDRAAFEKIVKANPFSAESDPRRVHVMFHNRALTPTEVAAVRAAEGAAGGRDQARVIGRALYVHTPDGFGRSALAARLTRAPRAGSDLVATARNWATVLKVQALLTDPL